jgi:hypothetical protein
MFLFKMRTIFSSVCQWISDTLWNRHPHDLPPLTIRHTKMGPRILLVLGVSSHLLKRPGPAHDLYSRALSLILFSMIFSTSMYIRFTRDLATG